MSATTNVQVVLNAKDNASATLKRFGNNVAGISTKSSKNLKQLGIDFKRAGLLATGLGAGFVAFGIKAGMSSARIEELGLALHAIAKANGVAQKAADKTVASLRGMNIAHKQALQVTALFIQSQLKLADATKIATAAKDLAVVAGMDSSEATQLLTRAIVMQRPVLLRQFGIVKGLDQIYDEYADKNKLVATSLTETQKKQAFLNTVLEQGKRTAGAYDAAMHSVSKRFRSLTGRIIPDFIAEIGKVFEPSLIIMINSITNSVKKMSKWITQNKDAIVDWGKKIGYATKIAVNVFSKLVNFLMSNKKVVIGILVAIGLSIGAAIGLFLVLHLTIIFVMSAIVVITIKALNAFDLFKNGVLIMKAVVIKSLALIRKKFILLEQTFLEVFDKTKSKLSDWATTTQSILSNWVESAKNIFQQFADANKVAVSKAVKPWQEDFIRQLKMTFNNIVMAMIDFDTKTLSLWGKLFGKWLSSQIEGLGKMAQGIGDWLNNQKTLLINRLEGWLIAFYTWLDLLPDVLNAVFHNLGIALSDWFKNQKTLWISRFQEWTTAFKTWLNNLPGVISEGLINIGVAIQTWWDTTKANTKTSWENLVTQAQTQLTILGKSISEGFQNIRKNLDAWLKKQYQNFLDWWSHIGQDSPKHLLSGWKQTEPGVAEKIVSSILALIGLILVTLVIGLAEAMRRGVVALHNAFIKEFNSIVPKIKKRVRDFINSIVQLVTNFHPTIRIGLHLPDIAGAWRSLKEKAHNMRVPGFQTGGIVPGPIGAPTPIIAHGGERVTPVGVGSPNGGGGGSVTFNVSVGLYAGTETEKRNIAQELYGALLQLAQSQNKNVMEYMGG